LNIAALTKETYALAAGRPHRLRTPTFRPEGTTHAMSGVTVK